MVNPRSLNDERLQRIGAICAQSSGLSDKRTTQSEQQFESESEAESQSAHLSETSKSQCSSLFGADPKSVPRLVIIPPISILFAAAQGCL